MPVVPFELFLIAGVLLGALSPLLTFARLFQMKEWRLDRLAEHLRREGWIRNLGGPIRAVIMVLYVAYATYGMVSILRMGGGGTAFVVLMAFHSTLSWWIGLSAALTTFQLATGKQRLPAWTSKSIAVVCTAFAMDAALAWWTMLHVRVFFSPLIPLLQPLVVFVAWLLWKPVDAVLKARVLRAGRERRDSLVDATVIGIVGSVGKTTTKELLKSVLADLTPFVTPDHVNTEMGVARWLATSIPAGAKKPLLIVEMGAYRKGEIGLLCRIAQPTIGVVTALGSDHLALFGSEEAIVEANAEILDALPANGRAFLLGDSATATGLRKRTRCPVTIAGSADAGEIRDADRGLAIESAGTRFNVALHGKHNASNALLAIAVARHFGVKEGRIRELLAAFRCSQHTFHLKKDRGVTILDDTYNVSPLSFRAALDWAKSRPERPRVLLTSGLLETGTEETRFLRELGAAAKASVERVVFTTHAGADAFGKAFGKDVERLTEAAPVTDDALLVCVGRMPASAIQKLLP